MRRIAGARGADEQHVREDLGGIRVFAYWAHALRVEPWMTKSQRLSQQFADC